MIKINKVYVARSVYITYMCEFIGEHYGLLRYIRLKKVKTNYEQSCREKLILRFRDRYDSKPHN